MDIPIPPTNTTRRYDCPSCGGKKTFTVTNQRGKVLYNCYKASCKFSGVKETTISKHDLTHLLKKSEKTAPTFIVPEHFTSALNHAPAMEYLKRNNCLEAVQKQRISVRYDPMMDRVVFLIRDQSGAVIDAVGRSLANALPKWYRYGKSDYPIIIDNGHTAILCEDAASACAVSSICTGVALMGTNLASTFIPVLKKYEKVIICLDKDASRKALAMQAELRFFVPCEIQLLKDDLKYFSTDEIKEMLSL